MATSPLYPGSDSRPSDRRVHQGHGTRELGPSDSSDSGSDLIGAPGLADDVGDDFPLDAPGTTSDPDRSHAGNTAGPDVGDANLDSDSDRFGTGETASASRDASGTEGRDIDADHIERIPPEKDEGR